MTIIGFFFPMTMKSGDFFSPKEIKLPSSFISIHRGRRPST